MGEVRSAGPIGGGLMRRLGHLAFVWLVSPQVPEGWEPELWWWLDDL